MAVVTVFNQVFVIFLLMATGYLAEKIDFIHESGAQDMTRILCYIVSPCVIIKAFQQPVTSQHVKGLGISFTYSLVIYFLSIIIAKIVFNKKTVKDSAHRNILQFSTVYSNAGFVGIPLLSAVLGTQGVFYGTPYLVAFNIFCWTHGAALYNEKISKKTLTRVFINPNIIAIVIGLLFFLGSVRLPALIMTGVTYIYDLNTPLSMLVIGYGIARIKLHTLFEDKWIWPGILMRNLVIPVIMLLLLGLIDTERIVFLANILMSACPVAAYAVIFAQMNDSDTAFATRLMTISTLFSVITIPLVVYLASWQIGV